MDVTFMTWLANLYAVVWDNIRKEVKRLLVWDMAKSSSLYPFPGFGVVALHVQFWVPKRFKHVEEVVIAAETGVEALQVPVSLHPYVELQVERAQPVFTLFR
jgi:hypothetical protein